MWGTILSLAGKALPVLLPFLGRLFPDSAKIQEVKAQKELKDAEAFAQGRMPPSYLLRYVLIVFLVLCGPALLLSVFFPQLSGEDLIDNLRSLVGIGNDIMGGTE
jgi:hypothetical protein